MAILSSTQGNRQHVLEIWGDFACFSRPDLKVERYSYPLPPPSAARGVLEAIYFKPEFYWQVTRIETLNPPSYIALRRNEVKDKASVPAIKQWISGKIPPEPLLADANDEAKGRTQRQMIALRNPRFRISAQMVPRPGHESKHRGFDEQFIRRASQGKCFHQPALGTRECVAYFRYIRSLESQPAAADYSQDLGLMLYDVFDLRQTNDDDAKPFVSLFQAKVLNGVLDVPPFESESVLKPELQEERA